MSLIYSSFLAPIQFCLDDVGRIQNTIFTFRDENSMAHLLNSVTNIPKKEIDLSQNSVRHLATEITVSFSCFMSNLRGRFEYERIQSNKDWLILRSDLLQQSGITNVFLFVTPGEVRIFLDFSLNRGYYNRTQFDCLSASPGFTKDCCELLYFTLLHPSLPSIIA